MQVSNLYSTRMSYDAMITKSSRLRHTFALSWATGVIVDALSEKVSVTNSLTTSNQEMLAYLNNYIAAVDVAFIYCHHLPFPLNLYIAHCHHHDHCCCQDDHQGHHLHYHFHYYLNLCHHDIITIISIIVIILNGITNTTIIVVIIRFNIIFFRVGWCYITNLRPWWRHNSSSGGRPEENFTRGSNYF